MESNVISLPIPGFPGYEALSTGQVVSYKRPNKRILKGKKDKDGYLEISMFNGDDERKYMRVHRVIAMMFVDGRSDEKKYC